MGQSIPLESPVILQPVCGQRIKVKTPQTINFNWTIPSGSPVNTQYNLKIIEIWPSGRNVNDAFQSAIQPVFFEKTINVNSYLFSASDPVLIDGKQYAFAVIAIDPANKVTFRNKGVSEVCSFSYGSAMKIKKKGKGHKSETEGTAK
jgi:hypothetical protein